MNERALQIEPALPGLGIEAIEHANRLHAAGEGFVFLCHKSGGYRGRWEQQGVRVGQLQDFLRSYPKSIDVYISQNRFAENRRQIRTLREADALWSDIDYYKRPDLADLHPELVAEEALRELEKARIPEPTAIIASGRGIYFLWLHSGIPLRELPRWNACQDTIHKALLEVGSDPATRRAQTVLRLPGTVNSKAGRKVEVLHETETVWDFEDLHREVVGEPEERKPAIIHPIEYEVAKRKRGPSFFARSRWNAATLWAGRFQDLRALKDYRWPHGVPEGFRDTFVYLSTAALSWLVTPDRLEGEAVSLGRDCVGRFDREALTNTRTTIKRALAAARGERIQWQGKEVDPRYRFKTETIVELLQIEDSEIRELDLRFLVSKSIDRERRALRKREARNPSPIQRDIQSHYMTKEQYHNRDSLEKQRPWESMGVSRATYYRRKAANEKS